MKQVYLIQPTPGGFQLSSARDDLDLESRSDSFFKGCRDYVTVTRMRFDLPHTDEESLFARHVTLEPSLAYPTTGRGEAM